MSDKKIADAIQEVIDVITAERGSTAVVVLFAPANGGVVTTMGNMTQEGLMDLLAHAATSPCGNARFVTTGRKLN